MNNLDAFFDVKKNETNNSGYSSNENVSFELDLEQFNNYTSNQQFEFIIEKTKLLHKLEHLEIFKIIDKNEDSYTSNENGVFVALNKLKPETLNEIGKFINFCILNKSTLQKDLDERDAIRKLMNCQNAEPKGFNKLFLVNDKNN
jgi:hypothetical protein